jgi:hypothetical protein
MSKTKTKQKKTKKNTRDVKQANKVHHGVEGRLLVVGVPG